MASHVALSGLLALFPFLIFGTALAGFLGADTFSETAVHLLFDTWPQDIADPLSREIEQVLTIPRGGLLTLSVLAAAYFASNGVEALRVSLNRAYRVSQVSATSSRPSSSSPSSAPCWWRCPSLSIMGSASFPGCRISFAPHPIGGFTVRFWC